MTCVALHHTAWRPAPWWFAAFAKVANIFLPTQNVGSPWDTFSQALGNAKQMRRRRSSGLRANVRAPRGGPRTDGCGVCPQGRFQRQIALR